MCKYYKHDDYYTVQKKEKLGDNDVENVFLSQRKESTRPTEQITHITGKVSTSELL